MLLDLVRGLAALLVLGEHWRILLYAAHAQLPERTWWIDLFFVVGGAGHAAVIIFFVLSGYLVGGSIFRSLKQRWSWKSYLIHRLVRLWIVLLPGLALCALFDIARLHWTHAPLFHFANSFPASPTEVHLRPSWPAFLGNVAFLQTIFVAPFGSDDALWSLANEFWYYILFPAGLLCVYARAWGARLVCATVFLGVSWMLPEHILVEFPVWLLGVALVFARPPQWGNKARWLTGLLYVPFVFFCAKSRVLPFLTMDYILALGTLFLLWVMLSARQPVHGEPLLVRAARVLARLSFTLYVVHMPLLVLLALIVRGNARWAPSGRNLLLGTPLLIASLVVAYVIAWMTEFRTDHVRKAVEGRLIPPRRG